MRTLYWTPNAFILFNGYLEHKRGTGCIMIYDVSNGSSYYYYVILLDLYNKLGPSQKVVFPILVASAYKSTYYIHELSNILHFLKDIPELNPVFLLILSNIDSHISLDFTI